MLGSIEDLEREIEQFQKNVMASGEVVTYLKQMSEQLRKQNETFEQKSASLIERLDTFPSEINKNSKKNDEELSININKMMADRKNECSSEQDTYIAELQKTNEVIRSAEKELSISYKNFGDKLEELNIGSLGEQIQQLKRELNMRTTILIGVSVVSVVLGIIGLFV